MKKISKTNRSHSKQNSFLNMLFGIIIPWQNNNAQKLSTPENCLNNSLNDFLFSECKDKQEEIRYVFQKCDLQIIVLETLWSVT